MKRRTNTQRAAEGLALCTLMNTLTGVETLPDQISDAMCQLMHTCRLVKNPEDGSDFDFEALLAEARVNFAAEIEEDPDV